MTTLAHVTTQSNTTSAAFRYGVEDAQRGELCVPEMIFVRRQQQVEYALGYESVKGVTLTTAQFTGHALPKVAPVAHKRRDGGEYTRWTDLHADKALKAAERRGKRLAAIAAKTAAESPEYAGDMLWLPA